MLKYDTAAHKATVNGANIPPNVEDPVTSGYYYTEYAKFSGDSSITDAADKMAKADELGAQYFGIAWNGGTYSLKAPVQIYDADNNALGIYLSKTNLVSGGKAALTGKIGETIYCTSKTGGRIAVKTIGGSDVKVTESNGVYSFVMPAEAVKVYAVQTKEVTVNYNVNGTLDNSQTITWDEENFSANMPTVTETDVKTFGYEYDGKLYKDVSSVFAAIGTPESTVTVNVIALRLETQDGAEIRASGTAGLRFTSIVGKSEYFSEFGMILTVRSNVDTNSENAKAVGIDNFDKESLSAASLKYIELVSTASGFNSYEKNGNTVFNLVLTNISEAHLTMQYIARTYVTVKYADGTTVTYYSDVDFENNARAPQDVGYSALDNAELSGITEDQKAFIRENYLSKKA